MKRIKLPIEIDCGKEKKTVVIEYVYNHVYDEYNNLIADLSRIKHISKEIQEIELEIKIAMERGAVLVLDKGGNKSERWEELKEVLNTRVEKNNSVKLLRKEVVKINEKFIQKNICELAIKILKDNDIEDPDLYSPDFWHKRVLPGEAWNLIISAINKDASKKKQAGK